jgi:hypothetical protein
MKTRELLVFCVTVVACVFMITRCEMHGIDHDTPAFHGHNDITAPPAPKPVSKPAMTPDPSIIPPQ